MLRVILQYINKNPRAIPNLLKEIFKNIARIINDIDLRKIRLYNVDFVPRCHRRIAIGRA
jgi:hypothetical protein